jgi:hypothetical protein
MDRQKYISDYNELIFNPKVWNLYSNIIFVYTPPKVGSTSLVSSLRFSASETYIVLHVHNETMLNILTGKENPNPYDVTITEIIQFNVDAGKKVLVIDIYRGPIERKMSEYFEKVAQMHFNIPEEEVKDMDMKKLVQRFNCLFFHLGTENYFVEKFHHGESVEAARSFDFAKKYVLISSKNNDDRLRFLKLRLHDFAHWGEILTELLKVEVIMVKDNLAETKTNPGVASVYKQLKETYQIPANFLERIQTSDQDFLSYLTESEQAQYLQKWQKNGCAESFDAFFTPEEFSLYQRISLENQRFFRIDTNHYLDFGCICCDCTKKRTFLKAQVKSGKLNLSKDAFPPIFHNQVVQEKKMKRVRHVVKTLERAVAVATANKLSKSKGSKLGSCNTMSSTFLQGKK